MAATPANSINESGASGLCNFDGTATFGTTALVNHNVVIGASANTVNNVAPSATSGIPLVSNGSSANPSFTTAVVAGGGTGDTSFTAYSVICGGTTSTGALQNVSGIGSSGQVLTSNGAGALPTWQAAASPSPSSTISLYDDFMCQTGVTGTSGDTNVASQMTWTYNGATSPNAGATWVLNSSTGAHPGVWTNQIVNSSPVNAFLMSSINDSAGNVMALGSGSVTINWIFKIGILSTNTNTYTMFIGLTDNPATPGNGVYFSYTNGTNSGQWQLIANASSTPQTTNTTTAADTNWHNAQIVINAAGTSAQYFLDGASLGTIATGLPTANLSPCFSIHRTAGTMPTQTIFVDAFYMNIALTSAR